MPETYKTDQKEPCRQCGHMIDEATSCEIKPRSPREGDIGMCVKCGAITIFLASGLSRDLTPEEKRELMLDPRIIEGQLIVRGMQQPTQRKDPDSLR